MHTRSRRDPLAVAALLLTSSAVAWGCRSATPSPAHETTWAEREPDCTFELGDGRQLLAWKFARAWSELDPASSTFVVVTSADGLTWHWLRAPSSVSSQDSLTPSEVDELVAPATSASRRRALIERVFPSAPTN